MLKKFFAVLVSTIFVIGFLGGCGDKSEKTNNDDLVTGALNFDTINVNDLKDEDIKAWYEEKHLEKGLYTKTTEEGKYILLAAGVQNTSGYSVEIISVEANENEIVVDGKLNAPKEDEMVAQVLTYPSALIKIDDVIREAVLGNFEEPSKEVSNNNPKDENEDIKTLTGVYSGYIDSNSIEMRIGDEYKAFRLSDLVKGIISKGTIQLEDVITVNYIENEHGQYVIQEIFLEPGYEYNK